MLGEWASCAGVDADALREMLQREYVLLAVLLRRVNAVLRQGTRSTDDALVSLPQRDRMQVHAPLHAHTRSCRAHDAGVSAQAEYAQFLAWDHASFADGIPRVAELPARLTGSAVNIHRFAEINVAPDHAPSSEETQYHERRDAMRKYITAVAAASAESWRNCNATEEDQTWIGGHKIVMLNSRGHKRFLYDVPRSGGMFAGIKVGSKDDVFAARVAGDETVLSLTVAQVRKVVDMKETVSSGGRVGGARGEGNAAQNSIIRGAMGVITPTSSVRGVNRGMEYCVLKDGDGESCGIAVASADGVTALPAPAAPAALEVIDMWECKWTCNGALAQAAKDASGNATGEVEYAKLGCLHGADHAVASMAATPELWLSLSAEAKAHYRPVGELLPTIRQIMMCSHVYGQRRAVRGVFVLRACLKVQRALVDGEEPALRDCYWCWQFFSDAVLSAGREKLMFHVTSKLLYFEPCLVAAYAAFMDHGDPVPAARNAYEKMRAAAGGVELVETRDSYCRSWVAQWPGVFRFARFEELDLKMTSALGGSAAGPISSPTFGILYLLPHCICPPHPARDGLLQDVPQGLALPVRTGRHAQAAKNQKGVHAETHARVMSLRFSFGWH